MGLWELATPAHLIAFGSDSMTTLPQSLTGFQLLKALVETHKSDDCLLWPMKRDKDGYGRVWHHGKTLGAHRVAFFLTHGRWPSNALHSCDNPPCFNPRHIGEGTTAVNQREKAERGRSLRGEQQHDAKLTAETVVSARTEYAADSSIGFSHLAAKYGVTPTAMRWAITGTTWDHIPGAIPSRHSKPIITHCKRGHELSSENVYWSQGKRSCKTCVLARGAK